MFGSYYFHPWGFGSSRRYPWGGYNWPHYGAWGHNAYGPGVFAGQSANNVWVGNFNRSAYSRQRLINTGDMEETTQTSTPTVIG